MCACVWYLVRVIYVRLFVFGIFQQQIFHFVAVVVVVVVVNVVSFLPSLVGFVVHLPDGGGERLCVLRDNGQDVVSAACMRCDVLGTIIVHASLYPPFPKILCRT